MKNIASDNNESVLSQYHPDQVQPNAVDINVDRMFKINDTEFVITKSKKTHRGSTEIFPNEDGLFELQANNAYEFLAEGIISLAEGDAGFVISRSTLNRNGLYITSGLYDSGYEGVMAGVIHVTSGTAKIEKGAGVGQFLLFDAETLSMYDGDYGVNKMDGELYA